MLDWILFGASFLYIAIVLIVVWLLWGYAHLPSIFSRKLVHIMVSLWIVLPVFWMTDPLPILLGPFIFTVLNACLAYGPTRYLFHGSRLGLVFFPFSLLMLLSLMLLGWLSRISVLLGVLVMGLGDGLAAVVGKSFSSLYPRSVFRVYRRYEKSAFGTLTMFMVSLALLFALFPFHWYFLILVALLGTIAELITPPSFDNLSVPFVVAIACEIIERLSW